MLHNIATHKLICRGVNKDLQESYRNPLEVLHDHFLVIPSSHITHRKVKGAIRLMGLLSKWEIRWLMDALMQMESQEDNSLCCHHWLPSERVDLWKNYLTLDNRKHCLWDLIADFLHRICSGVTAGFTNVIRSIDQSRIIDSKTEPTSACSWLVVQFLKGLICRP